MEITVVNFNNLNPQGYVIKQSERDTTNLSKRLLNKSKPLFVELDFIFCFKRAIVSQSTMYINRKEHKDFRKVPQR